MSLKESERQQPIKCCRGTVKDCEGTIGIDVAALTPPRFMFEALRNPGWGDSLSNTLAAARRFSSELHCRSVDRRFYPHHPRG